jgi:hypothetical protein
VADSKKKTSETKPSKKAPVRFKKPSEFGESWVGRSPIDIDPDFDKENPDTKLTEKDVFDAEIGVFGYLELQTEFKGEQKPFMIMTCTSIDNTAKPFTVVSSGKVILKKMRKIGKENGFPVAGKFIDKIDGKDYFNFVDIDD